MRTPRPQRKGRNMRLRRLRLLLPVLALAAFGGALSSCGGGDEGASTEGTGIPSEFKAPTSASDSAQTGGDLTVLNEGDIDYMDPGAAYYQVTYVITLATQRGLMGWPPDATQPAPDLAEDDPEVS